MDDRNSNKFMMTGAMVLAVLVTTTSQETRKPRSARSQEARKKPKS